jgi:hypothetical protein
MPGYSKLSKYPPDISYLLGDSTRTEIIRVEGYSIALITRCDQSDQNYDPILDQVAKELLMIMEHASDFSGTLLVACEEPIYYPEYKREQLADEGVSLERYHPSQEEFDNGDVKSGLEAQARKMIDDYWRLRVLVRNQLISHR